MVSLDESESFSPRSFEVDPTIQLREFDSAIREVLRCEFSFDNINLLYHYMEQASQMFIYLSDYLLLCGPNSKGAHRRLGRLEKALDKTVAVATLRIKEEKTSLSLRLDLERHLAGLLSKVTSVPEDSPDDFADVICVYGRGYFRVSALSFYLSSRTVHSRGSWYVAQIPRRLHQALTDPQNCLALATFDPNWELGNILRADAQDLIYSTCAPVPSPEVFADALVLWSDDAGNMYHDIAKAVTAVSKV